MKLRSYSIHVNFYHDPSLISNYGAHELLFLMFDLLQTNGQINLSFAGGFDLPRIQPSSQNINRKGNKKATTTTTFYDLLDSLRDMATWSVLERLQGYPKGHFTNDLKVEMHQLMQDLMYFRNVDGSFGEAMTQQNFQ